MSIFNFISKLTGETKKTNIQDDLAYTKKILDETTLPMAAAFVSSVSVTPKHSEAFKRAEDIFYTATRHKGKDFARDLEAVLRNVRNNLNFIEKEVTREIADNTFRDAINLRHAQLFQAAAGVGMVADLTIEVINFITTAEHAVAGGDVHQSSGEMKTFVEKMRKLAKLLNSYGTEPRFFENVMKKIPDAMVTDQNKSMIREAYAKDGDPYPDMELADGFISHPVFFIREIWASYQIARYDSQKAQKKKFELLVLTLKAQRAGESTAALEKQIQYYDNQIAKLADKIESFEEKYR